MERIKNLLATAAGPKGQGDETWHAAGVDRLYFSDPQDVNACGQVDVLRRADDKEPNYVRLELWVRPELAAFIISRVTGESQALDERLRFDIENEMIAKYRPTTEPEMVEVEPSSIDLQDAARAAELNALIAEQKADEERQEEQRTNLDVSDEPETGDMPTVAPFDDNTQTDGQEADHV